MAPRLAEMVLQDQMQDPNLLHHSRPHRHHQRAREPTSFFLGFITGSSAKKAAKSAADARAAEEEAKRVPASERMENAVNSAHEGAYEAAQAAQASRYAMQQARTSTAAAEAASAEIGFLLQRKREALAKARAALRSPKPMKVVAKPPPRALPSRRVDGPSNHGELRMMATERTMSPVLFFLPTTASPTSALAEPLGENIEKSQKKSSARVRGEEASSFLLLDLES